MEANGYRVLVADDEEVIRDACERILTRNGFEVDLAVDGLEAFDRVGKDRYDLLVLDIKMPGLDGISLMERLGREDRLPRVVVITGHGTSRTAVEARKAGASSFLTKPFTPRQLRRAVTDALAGPEGKKTEAGA